MLTASQNIEMRKGTTTGQIALQVNLMALEQSTKQHQDLCQEKILLAVGMVHSKGVTENGHYINGNKLAITLIRKTHTTSLHQT